MKGPYRDYSISCVEREIISLYKERKHMHDDRKHAYCLLSLRKKMLDYWARKHQYDLLPVIKEFNMAVNCALEELCKEAHSWFMGQNAGYDVLSSPINTGMRDS